MGDHSKQLRETYARTNHIHSGNHCEFVVLRTTKDICQWGQKSVMKKVVSRNLRIIDCDIYVDLQHYDFFK